MNYTYKKDKNSRKILFTLKLNLLFGGLKQTIIFLIILIGNCLFFNFTVSSSVPFLVFLPIIIFIFIGWFLFFVFRNTIKYIQIIKNGQIAFGILTKSEKTDDDENLKPIFKLFYEFKTTSGETYIATVRTHLVSLLNDEESEPLVYNPYNPKEAIFIDVLPIKVRKFLNKYIEEYKQQNNTEKQTTVYKSF
ncbi:MAG: hypothetical protein L3J35_09895 [Bacteroidales bacterium]|nr:hypothetical protein [Bacteroidales bacterium]